MSAKPETSIEIYNDGNVCIETATSWVNNEPKNGIIDHHEFYRESIREIFPSILALRHSLVRDKFHQDSAYVTGCFLQAIGFIGGGTIGYGIGTITDSDNSILIGALAYLGYKIVNVVHKKAIEHKMTIVDSQVKEFNSQVKKFQQIFPTVESYIKPVQYSVRDYLHSFNIDLPRLPFR